MKELAVREKQELEQHWREFFDKNKSLVYTTCFRYVNDAGTAEDITQETFIKFFQSFDAARGSPEAFLKTIAVNISIDFLRKRKTQREVFLEEGEELGEESHEDSPAYKAVRCESAEKVCDALKSIEEYCRAFLYYLSQGFKLQEVARIMKTAEAKIRSDSVRCRRKALYVMCIHTGVKNFFSAAESEFIKCYFEKVYSSKDSVMKRIGLSDSDFVAIHDAILEKLGQYYSSE